MEELQKRFGKGSSAPLKKGGRAVIYVRVSSKEQELGYSPEVQKECCSKWAEQHNFQVVRCFEGEHESASSDANRKRFNEMLNYVKKKSNNIDAVIVYSMSRFSRTGQSSFSIVDELKDRGIVVYSASSGADARKPDGELLQGMELLLARHDNALKSQAVMDAGEKALRSGRWINMPPMGYEMKTTSTSQTITVNDTGRLIQKAFLMKAQENLSTEEVRVRMKELGLNLAKQRWSGIFKNVFYAGYYSHRFLKGEIIQGKQEALVSIEDFLKINNILLKTHTSGYEVKYDKEYAPLLGLLKCPHCGHNLTASLSTKMRKAGKDIGYYVCSRKGCKCNSSTKLVNTAFEECLGNITTIENSELLRTQLMKAFSLLNQSGLEELKTIKTNITYINKKIEQVEENLAMSDSPKMQEVCLKQLQKLEGQRDEYEAVLAKRDKEILNLQTYVEMGLKLRGNILELWMLANLPQKKRLQGIAFPQGVIYNKENGDIEPLSRNDFLFVNDCELDCCENKENGQTVYFDNLSALAPQLGLEPRTP